MLWTQTARCLQQNQLLFSLRCITRAQYSNQSKKESGFDDYFHKQYGTHWPTLRSHLSHPTSHCALVNRFADNNGNAHGILLKSLDISPSKKLSWLPSNSPILAYIYNHHHPGQPSSSSSSSPPYPPPLITATPNDHQLKPWYWLDPASIIPALALNVVPGQSVLDMCCAPGGKSIILAHCLLQDATASSSSSYANKNSNIPEGSRLVCNEVNHMRRSRLRKVLTSYLPKEYIDSTGSSTVMMSQRDGTWWNKHQHEMYDKVLVDAPCSSDRHVLQQAQGKVGTTIKAADWNVKRVGRLAKLQMKLVVAGLNALKVGGRLVYSTCSIASEENDEVIRGVLGRIQPQGAVDVVSSLPLVDDNVGVDEGGGVMKTEYGWMLVPNNSVNWGPIYVAVLEKKMALVDMKRRKI